MTETATYQRTFARCQQPDWPHKWNEHVVGKSPNGRDIIDVVCPECGNRIAAREVASNPEGERYDEF